GVNAGGIKPRPLNVRGQRDCPFNRCHGFGMTAEVVEALRTASVNPRLFNWAQVTEGDLRELLQRFLVCSLLHRQTGEGIASLKERRIVRDRLAKATERLTGVADIDTGRPKILPTHRKRGL